MSLASHPAPWQNRCLRGPPERRSQTLKQGGPHLIQAISTIAPHLDWVLAGSLVVSVVVFAWSSWG